MGAARAFPLPLIIGLLLFLAGPAAAQQPPAADTAAPASPPAAVVWPALKGHEKKILLLIAREALAAAMENRPSREARVEPRLKVAQPVVLSIYVDGKLRARSWKIKNIQPIYLAARDLLSQALAEPKVSDQPLSQEELARAKIGLAVLGRYARANNDQEIPPKSAVIIYNGFKEWLALPGDVPGGSAADILSLACGQAGLRPQAWLLPETTTIFHAKAEEMKEPGA
jgi:AMMECR1 domain-containing protein